MRRFRFDLAAVRLLARNSLRLLVAEQGRAFAQLVAARARAGLLATLSLAVLGGRFALSFALALAFREAIALLHQEVHELLLLALFAGLAGELLAPFAELAAVGAQPLRHLARGLAERALAVFAHLFGRLV